MTYFIKSKGNNVRNQTIESVKVNESNIDQHKHLALAANNKILSIKEQWDGRSGEPMTGFYTSYINEDGEKECVMKRD
jgi:hypothetical protein